MGSPSRQRSCGAVNQHDTDLVLNGLSGLRKDLQETVAYAPHCFDAEV